MILPPPAGEMSGKCINWTEHDWLDVRIQVQTPPSVYLYSVCSRCKEQREPPAEENEWAVQAQERLEQESLVRLATGPAKGSA